MKCEKCGARIPDDSLFCPECGIELTNATFATKVGKGLDASSFEEVKTIWPTLSFLSWCITTVVFAFGLPILLDQLKLAYTWTYYLSIVLYIVTILLAVKGFIEDRRLLKKGKTAKGNSLNFTMITLSAYCIVTILQTIAKG